MTREMLSYELAVSVACGFFISPGLTILNKRYYTIMYDYIQDWMRLRD